MYPFDASLKDKTPPYDIQDWILNPLALLVLGPNNEPFRFSNVKFRYLDLELY